MQQAARTLLFIPVSFVLLSLVYFSGLLLHLPFVFVAAGGFAALFFSARAWLRQQSDQASGRLPVWSLAALAIACIMIVKKSIPLAKPYGEWDAWAIWNLHMKYLLLPGEWTLMFRNLNYGHPDYPLGLPAFLAFCVRLCGGHFSAIIPFVFCFMVGISIPAFILFLLARKNAFIAVLALLPFATALFYVQQVTTQYADTPLAFLFLCAIGCIYYAKEHRHYILLSAFFAASCMWMKNEGAVLAFIFLLFNAPTFFSRSALRYTVAGFILPMLAFLIFKVFFATGNDMLDGLGTDTIGYITDAGRYKQIYLSFKENLDKNFEMLKWPFIIYLLFSLLRRQWPDRQFLMLCFCLLAYMGFYVVSVNDLEWHLRTSQDRLMHQLMPSFVFVMAYGFAGMKFPAARRGIPVSIPFGKRRG